jgi:hypothetical protein
MGVKIRNLLTSGPIIVPLSTGASVRLSPGQISDELPDVAVADNPKVDKLRTQGLIDVEETDTKAKPGEDETKAKAGEGETESRPRSRKRSESAG